jgi:hypothetical protein
VKLTIDTVRVAAVIDTMTTFFVKTATDTANVATFAANIAIFSVKLRITVKPLRKIRRRDRQSSRKQHTLLRESLNSFASQTRQTSTVNPLQGSIQKMPRAQRTSRILDKGQLRILKLKAIDPYMSFGNDRNLSTLSTQIEELHTKLNEYNTTIAALDVAKQELDQMERSMGDLLDQLLNGVSAKYGNDSREYEMAGGTRKSDRVRKSAQTRRRSGATKKTIAANN